jgi:aspartyl-tRNA(Asn)/glutamyl-tRNA(Gln) amidotransferase subunit A
VSRYGMVAFASSLDQGGVLAHTARDLALVLQAIQGFDAADSTSVDRTDARLAGFIAGNASDMHPCKIGWPREYFEHVTDERFAQCFVDARRLLERRGATFVDVSLPRTDAAVPTYYVVASAEASTNLSRFDGVRYGHRCASPQDLEDLYRRSRREGFGTEVRRRILTGTYALSVGYYDAYYKKAQRIRRLIRDEFGAAFEQVDAILAPTSPNVAFPLAALTADPVTMYRQDIFTIPASLAGVPVVALPCGFVDDLPVGMQLIGPHFGEAELLALGDIYQRDTDWHTRRPRGLEP